jgi:hypothetical protein
MSEQQTPDREKKIAEIREALEKATPGPWAFEVIQTHASHLKPRILGPNIDMPHFNVRDNTVSNSLNDAHLIANAPEWLRFLLSELEREREELERIKCSNCGNEGIYETGIEKDGLRETKFCGQCVYGERAKMMHELRSALFESEEENRKLREERDFWKGQYDRQVERSVFLGEMVERLREERDKLIEGLQFYGDEETYEGDVEWDDAGNIIHAKWAPINLDNGKCARDILAEIGVTVE